MSAPNDLADGRAKAPVAPTVELLMPLGGGPGREVRLCRRVGPLGDGTLFAFRPLADLVLSHEGARADASRRIELARHLRHPGWVDVIGAETAADGTTGLLFELVAGMDLDGLVARGPLTLAQVAHIGARVAGALDGLHRGRDLLDRPRRLVHGSVTPDKVLLSFTGDVKLLDFGVTRTSPRALGGVAAWPAGLAPWAPPESLDGAPPSAEGDLYMLGTTLYLMLTGRPPFAPGERPTLARLTHLAPPSRVRGDVRASLDALVMGMLEPDPARRPADALEVREALDGVSVRRGLAARVRDVAGAHYKALAEVLRASAPPRADTPAVLLVPPAPATRPPEPPRAPHLPPFPSGPPSPNYPLVPAPIDPDAVVEAPVLIRAPRPVTAGELLPAPTLPGLPPPLAPPKLDPADSLERIANEVHDLWSGPRPTSYSAQARLSSPPQQLALPAPAVDPTPAPPAHLDRRWAIPPLLAALSVLIWAWPAGPGILEIRAQPASARIIVDGEAVSPAEATFSLPAGPHEVQILAEGHYPVRVQEELRSGERRILVVALEPEAPKVVLTPAPLELPEAAEVPEAPPEEDEVPLVAPRPAVKPEVEATPEVVRPEAAPKPEVAPKPVEVAPRPEVGAKPEVAPDVAPTPEEAPKPDVEPEPKGEGEDEPL
ncbi:MAG: protein kinase [Deltaproteobacteria bacterium]|nr:protein kinase [Deltaproteobacteria bacterium]